MYYAIQCHSYTEATRAILGHDRMDVGIVCSNASGSWEPLHVIDVNGNVQPLPHCFSLTAEALEMLDAIAE